MNSKHISPEVLVDASVFGYAFGNVCGFFEKFSESMSVEERIVNAGRTGRRLAIYVPAFCFIHHFIKTSRRKDDIVNPFLSAALAGGFMARPRTPTAVATYALTYGCGAALCYAAG